MSFDCRFQQPRPIRGHDSIRGLDCRCQGPASGGERRISVSLRQLWDLYRGRDGIRGSERLTEVIDKRDLPADHHPVGIRLGYEGS